MKEELAEIKANQRSKPVNNFVYSKKKKNNN
jgi:hypothetical protein